jgi:hypothetical protein
MARVIAADGAAIDHGSGAVYGEILWQEVCILGYVIVTITKDELETDCVRMGQVDGVEVSC